MDLCLKDLRLRTVEPRAVRVVVARPALLDLRVALGEVGLGPALVLGEVGGGRDGDGGEEGDDAGELHVGGGSLLGLEVEVEVTVQKGVKEEVR